MNAGDRGWSGQYGAPLYVLLDLPVAALGNGTYSRARGSHQPRAGRLTRCTMENGGIGVTADRFESNTRVGAV